MANFNLEKELSKIQNRKEKNTKRTLNRFLTSTLILMLVLTVSLNATYSVKTTSSTSVAIDNYKVTVTTENAYQDSYDIYTNTGEINSVIDSEYKKALLICDNGNFKYDEIERTIIGKNINSDVNCTLSFDTATPKSKINIKELNEINDNSGTSYYYNTNATNNYIMMDYMEFRIVRVNGDGTLRLILNSSVSDENKANIMNTLNSWYENNLKDNKYIINSSFDTDLYNSNGQEFTNSLISFNSFYTGKVGLLSANEIININKNKVIDPNSYLYGKYYTFSDSDIGLWVVRNGFLTTIDDDLYGIRPVINIRINNLSGTGTVNDPFIIEEA